MKILCLSTKEMPLAVDEALSKVEMELETLAISKETKVVPGMPLLQANNALTIANSSDTEVYIFVTLDVKAEKDGSAVSFKNKAGETIAAPFEITYSKTEGTQNFTKLTGVNGVENVYFVKTSAASVAFADQITLSTSVHSESTIDSVGDVMAANVVITVTAEAIQSYELSTEVLAYNALHSA